jgi:hypothetical protein
LRVAEDYACCFEAIGRLNADVQVNIYCGVATLLPVEAVTPVVFVLQR